jgi:alginate O-acetyltransferase complex protein AlgI
MVFSSIVFLLFFLPAFFITYYLADRKFKNIVILVFSVVFYAWGAPKFIFVILGTTLLDFYLVKWMDATSHERSRKLMLLLSVSVNVGLLFYFKYSNFFIENVNAVLSVIGIGPIAWAKLILPIGISFYTFETITYVVDVYRRVHKPLNNFWDYQTYIMLFPKLIAGPIIRYHDLSHQITDRSANENFENRLKGFYRFTIGLAKKVLIANQMGAIADSVFAMEYAKLGSLTAWVGILAYTLQIYFDFSGYSDMAIGLGKMMGFKFPENFDNPYTSKSITEFWRRWHMTLGSWMKNYLYIPLGGNQVSSKGRLYFNLCLVFFLSGLWHGASWSFVVWGLFHGLFLVLERIGLSKVYERIGKIPSVLITFIIVMVGWVFFRVEHLGDALVYIKKMIPMNLQLDLNLDLKFLFYAILALCFAFITLNKWGKKLHDLFYLETFQNKNHLAFSFISVLLLVLCIASITGSGFNPFIYFRF